MSSEITTPEQLRDDAAAAQEALAPQRRLTVIRPPSFSLKYLGDLVKLWQYRDLLYTLTVHRIKVRYKQSVLGIAWAILQPVSLMLIYTVIFSYIARMPSDGTPYAIFAYTALLPWSSFSTTLSNATNGLVSHSHLVTKVYFPREILPLTYVIAGMFDFLIASSVLVGLLVYYDIRLTAYALYALPIVGVLLIFTTAMSLLFSATQVRFRDVGVAMPLLLQLWMFATPVVYPLSAVPVSLRPFYSINPMVGLIENFRQVMLRGAPPNLKLLAIAAAGSFLLLIASYVYFKHIESTVADII
jgi:lipopolysaccharide transport system permease protein